MENGRHFGNANGTESNLAIEKTDSKTHYRKVLQIVKADQTTQNSVIHEVARTRGLEYAKNVIVYKIE